MAGASVATDGFLDLQDRDFFDEKTTAQAGLSDIGHDQPDRVEKGLRELIVRDAAVGTVFCDPRRAAVSGMIRLHLIGI